MRKPKLHGADDLFQTVLIVAVVATITWFLLGHLRARRELFSVARERSFSAYHLRELEEQGRHLRLEQRIREAGVRSAEAPSQYQPAPPERTLALPPPTPLAPADSTPWDEEGAP